jgi:phosphate starvation-inducible PhoH-like protein
MRLVGKQNQFLSALYTHRFVIVTGPAGTGKTLVPLFYAHKKKMNVMVCRPIVAASHEIGHLPGTASDKLYPYFRPIKDNVKKFGLQIEVTYENLGFMRGLTFENTLMILDECQNASVAEVRLFLTRLGLGSQIVLAGDIRQSDLNANGLTDAVTRFEGLASHVELDEIVRDPFVADIESRYQS